VSLTQATPALASSPLPSANSRPVVVSSPVVFAESVTWYGFVRYWRGFVNRADRVVLVVGLVAAAALFIITRGKWIK
jgi:hypothetical protein